MDGPGSSPTAGNGTFPETGNAGELAPGEEELPTGRMTPYKFEKNTIERCLKLVPQERDITERILKKKRKKIFLPSSPPRKKAANQSLPAKLAIRWQGHRHRKSKKNGLFKKKSTSRKIKISTKIKVLFHLRIKDNWGIIIGKHG